MKKGVLLLVAVLLLAAAVMATVLNRNKAATKEPAKVKKECGARHSCSGYTKAASY